MAGKRFIMNAGRTTKQGQQINIGKDSPEYKAIVGTLTMHPEDMQEAGIQPGGSVRVRSDYGEVIFLCNAGKVPQGMIFVPYGPPTCHLMGQIHRWHRDANVQRMGSRGRGDRARDSGADRFVSGMDETDLTQKKIWPLRVARRGTGGGKRCCVGDDRGRTLHAAPHPRKLPRPGAWLNVRHSARFGREQDRVAAGFSRPCDVRLKADATKDDMRQR